MFGNDFDGLFGDVGRVHILKLKPQWRLVGGQKKRSRITIPEARSLIPS